MNFVKIRAFQIALKSIQKKHSKQFYPYMTFFFLDSFDQKCEYTYIYILILNIALMINIFDLLSQNMYVGVMDMWIQFSNCLRPVHSNKSGWKMMNLTWLPPIGGQHGEALCSVHKKVFKL